MEGGIPITQVFTAKFCRALPDEAESGIDRVNGQTLLFKLAAPEGLALRLADTIGAAARTAEAAPGDQDPDGHEQGHHDENSECQQ